MNFLENYGPVKQVIDIMCIKSCDLVRPNNYFACSTWTTFFSIFKLFFTLSSLIVLTIFGTIWTAFMHLGLSTATIASMLQLYPVVLCFNALQVDAILSRHIQVTFLNALIAFERTLVVKLKYIGKNPERNEKLIFLCVTACLATYYVWFVKFVLFPIHAAIGGNVVDIIYAIIVESFGYIIILIVMHICYLGIVLLNRYRILNKILRSEFALQPISINRFKVIVGLFEQLFQVQQHFGNLIRGQIIIIKIMDFALVTVIVFSMVQFILVNFLTWNIVRFYLMFIGFFIFKFFYLATVFEKLANQVRKYCDLYFITQKQFCTKSVCAPGTNALLMHT